MFRLMLVATLVLACIPAYAGDFPGVGDPAAWSDAIPYYNRGNRYLTQGRYEDAVKDFTEAVARYPDDPDFYVNLGVALRKTENYKGAEQAFKSALKLRPKDWMSWNNLGNAYLKQDRLKDTLAAFEQALKFNPPASDKAALLQDIADIHKLLRATGQEPLPTPKPPPGKPGTGKPRARAHAPSTAAPSTAAPAPTSTKPTPATKEWGYE